MMQQKTELLKQFDKDGNGWLNASERKAAREFLQKENAGGRGRRIDPPTRRQRQFGGSIRRAAARQRGRQRRVRRGERNRQHPLEQRVEFVELLTGQVVRAGGGGHEHPSAAEPRRVRGPASCRPLHTGVEV